MADSALAPSTSQTARRAARPTRRWGLRALPRLLAPLALAALACSLLQPLAPTAAPVPTPTPALSTVAAATATPPAPPTAASPPPSPTAGAPAEPEDVILLDLVLDRLRRGEVERGTVIAEALRFVVGEAGVADVAGPNVEISEPGTTGLIRLAEHYLASGAGDPAARAEVQRLLDRLMPPLERLEEHARPATGPAFSASPRHAARTLIRPLGDEALCSALWADGFRDPATTICLEYATRAIGGREHRMYYPAYWPPDDPRRAYLPLFLEALEEALAVFNAYGPQPVKPIVMVFTDLAFLGEHGRDEDVYAAAVRGGGGRVCRMGVFPTATAQDPAGFKQTVAHELFHCWQFTNLDAQEAGPNPDHNAWWVEGSAEFFSSVVYPAVNEEWRWAPHFDNQSLSHGLLSMTYPNVLWFQYLAHGAGLGTEGVLTLLRSLPTAGGGAEQEAALARFPGIENHFHNFGRAYLDRALVDLSGEVVPVSPRRGPDTTFVIGGGEQPYQPLPFFIHRFQLHWEADARFGLTVTTIGVGRSAVRTAETRGLWTGLPTAINSACEEVVYLLLVTTTAAGDADPHELNVAYTGEAATGCEDCLVGDWQLVNESYIAFLDTLTRPDDAIRYTAASGATIFTFKDDGNARTRHEGFVLEGVISQETLDGSALDLPLSMALRGGSEARYTAADGLLTFSEGDYNVTADMNLNGVPLNDFVFSAEDFGLGAGEARYTCLGDALTYRPIIPGRETTRPMDFVRLTPPRSFAKSGSPPTHAPQGGQSGAAV